MTTQTLEAQKTGLLAGVAAWDGTKLAIPNEEVLAKTRRKRLSPSTAKAMQDCGARWVAEKILPQNEDPFGPAPIGTGAHDVLERLYDLPPQERTLVKAAEIREQNCLKIWPETGDETDAEYAQLRLNRSNWNRDVEDAYLGLWTIEDPMKVQVYSVEQEINVDIGGVPATGKIDRIDEIEIEGVTELLVGDYKSSRKLPRVYFGDEHGEQIRTYILLIQAKLKRRAVGGQLLYTRIGKLRSDESEVEPIDVSDKALDKTLKTFQLSWKRHNRYHDQGLFPTKASNLCGYCPLVNSCPAAIAKGKTVADPKKEFTLSAQELGIEKIENFVPMQKLLPAVSKVSETEATPHEESENQMSHQIIEDSPWVKTVGKSKDLNPNSYTSGGLFGLVNLATEQLTKQRPGDFGHEEVRALTSAFAFIVAEAQSEWVDSRDPQEGSATRMRGVLHTFIEGNPPPLTDTPDAFETWIDDAINRCVAATTVVLELFVKGDEEGSWEGLIPAKVEPPKPKRASRAKAQPASVPEPAEDAPVDAPDEATLEAAEEPVKEQSIDEPVKTSRQRTTRAKRTPAAREDAEVDEANKPSEKTVVAEPEPLPTYESAQKILDEHRAKEAEAAPEEESEPAEKPKRQRATRSPRTPRARSSETTSEPETAVEEAAEEAPPEKAEPKKRKARNDEWFGADFDHN